ncbi:hypothetical protein ABPG72_004069 [Tetrahymena utriculariae]
MNQLLRECSLVSQDFYADIYLIPFQIKKYSQEILATFRALTHSFTYLLTKQQTNQLLEMDLTSKHQKIWHNCHFRLPKSKFAQMRQSQIDYIFNNGKHIYTNQLKYFLRSLLSSSQKNKQRCFVWQNFFYLNLQTRQKKLVMNTGLQIRGKYFLLIFKYNHQVFCPQTTVCILFFSFRKGRNNKLLKGKIQKFTLKKSQQLISPLDQDQQTSKLCPHLQIIQANQINNNYQLISQLREKYIMINQVSIKPKKYKKLPTLIIYFLLNQRNRETFLLRQIKIQFYFKSFYFLDKINSSIPILIKAYTKQN